MSWKDYFIPVENWMYYYIRTFYFKMLKVDDQLDFVFTTAVFRSLLEDFTPLLLIH